MELGYFWWYSVSISLIYSYFIICYPIYHKFNIFILIQVNIATPKRPRSFREQTLLFLMPHPSFNFSIVDIWLFRNLQDWAQPTAIRVRSSVRSEHTACAKCTATRHITQVEASAAQARIHAARRKPERCSCASLCSISVWTTCSIIVYYL